jgi:chromosome segregation ATPase
MKIIYISLLSVAIIGQAGYFCYDYQAKKQQSELNDSFHEQTVARLSQLERKANSALLDVKTLKELYPTLVDKAVKISATQIEQLQDRVAQLQDRQTQSQDRQTQTDKAIEQTRQQIDNQTNDLASAVNKLRLNNSELQDTGLELTARKTERADVVDKALKEKIRRRTAWLFNPEAAARGM